MVATAALNQSLWLPYVISALGLIASFPIIYWTPETFSPDLRTNITMPSLRRSTKLLVSSVSSASKNFSVILTDKKVFAGLICVFLGHFSAASLNVIFQYVSYKFHWTLSEVSNVDDFLLVFQITKTSIDNNHFHYNLHCQYHFASWNHHL